MVLISSFYVLTSWGIEYLEVWFGWVKSSVLETMSKYKKMKLWQDESLVCLYTHNVVKVRWLGNSGPAALFYSISSFLIECTIKDHRLLCQVSYYVNIHFPSCFVNSSALGLVLTLPFFHSGHWPTFLCISYRLLNMITTCLVFSFINCLLPNLREVLSFCFARKKKIVIVARWISRARERRQWNRFHF